MVREALEMAECFVEEAVAVEEETRVERVRRVERFRPVVLGGAVDKEVAAWHSTICGKMKLHPGAKRDPFRPRTTRHLPEVLR